MRLGRIVSRYYGARAIARGPGAVVRRQARRKLVRTTFRRKRRR